ncbi:cytochrome b561 and DOMON domain-containing protein [Canna indica]|uniref:Cytochrome b561 and DOMON domain-containing protein n=1 Tax=Canna indica TaxID=4628 RepID=A0AAQ3KTT1_9LILI|nr:cytochrome b561 and DOMON domain-containing protein [Canna indica]
MKKSLFLFLLLNFFLSSFSSAQAQSCTGETFSGNRPLYAFCNSLLYLRASLHWTYHAVNGTLDVAYRAPQSASGWVAWAINPSATGMIGANAFLAFPDSSTGAVTIWTTQFHSRNPTVQNEGLSFPVYNREAEYASGFYTIYATLELPANSTKVNSVWQSSTQLQNGEPSGHPTYGDNTNSKEILDLLSGQTTAAGGGNSRQHRKNIHGVMNAVSWGIMMPTGVIIARYLKVFPSAHPAWYYLHIACQISAYIIGVSGWGLGLKLGSESPGIVHHKHRNIGITLFVLATLQVFALFLRPDKKNKYRIYWNVYHHTIGYLVIILSVVNIFKGFDILLPANKWKHAYIAVIVLMAAVAVFLEVFTWIVVLRRRSKKSENSQHSHGVSGYGVKQNQGV